MVGAALAHARYPELIPDLLHVHAGAIKVALRAIPKLYCVTDSTAATGMPDGAYMLGSQHVHKCTGGSTWPTPRAVCPPTPPIALARTHAGVWRLAVSPISWCSTATSGSGPCMSKASSVAKGCITFRHDLA